MPFSSDVISTATPQPWADQAEQNHTNSLLRLWEAVVAWTRECPATFEIRNIKTGELASDMPVWSDGTAADRAARALGRDWRVVRRD